MAETFYIDGTINTTGPAQSRPEGTRYNYITIDTGNTERTLNRVGSWNAIDSKVSPGVSGRFYFSKSKTVNWLVAYEGNGKVINVAPSINATANGPMKFWGILTAIAVLIVLFSTAQNPELLNFTFWLPVIPAGRLIGHALVKPDLPEDLSVYRAS